MTAGVLALVQAESTKLRSVRSSIWLLVATGVAVVGLTAILAAAQMSGWSSMSAQSRADLIDDPIGNTLPVGALWGALAAAVLGVLVVTNEYSTGIIRSSLLAVPRRTPVLVTKVGAYAGAVLVVAEIAAFGAYLVARALMHEHVSMSLGDLDTLGAVASLGLYVTVIGLFALSVGAVIRHVAGALATVLALTVLVPMLAAQLPDDLGRFLTTFLPGSNAGQAIVSTSPDPDALLAPWASFAITCGWTAVIFAVAVQLLNRRDA